MRKPSINLNGPANQYAAPDERIVEFTFPDGSGGLISFCNNHIEIYRTDPSVTVAAPMGSTKLQLATH